MSTAVTTAARGAFSTVRVAARRFDYEAAKHVLHWTLPSAIVPTVRYFFVDPKEKRREYYVRDLVNFALGAVVFWGTKKSVLPMVQKLGLVEIAAPHPQAKRVKADAERFVAFLAALTAQTLNNGLLAVKLSHLVGGRPRQTGASGTGADPTNAPISATAPSGLRPPPVGVGAPVGVRFSRQA
jgi:hypothetical protein